MEGALTPLAAVGPGAGARRRLADDVIEEGMRADDGSIVVDEE